MKACPTHLRFSVPALLACAAATLAMPAAATVHSVTDIGHEFSFYADGRFFSQYLSGGDNSDARNWGTLHKCDLTNVNLLVLMSGGTPCPYTPKDIAAVKKLLDDGGGVVVLGNFGTFREQKDYQLNSLARALGAEFLNEQATLPFKASPSVDADKIQQNGGKILKLADPADWQVLVTDAAGRALLARKKVGKGSLLIGNRGLFGQNPDASDPINASWVRPLLEDLASAKQVDPAKPNAGQGFDLKEKHGQLMLSYSDYTRHEAQQILSLYDKCMPLLGEIFGVPPSQGTMTGLLLLPTGGGGFSSGANVGLGIWWGDFPNNLYPMIEFIGHEGAHSWVLPFGEPFWNEPIATYIGALMARRMGRSNEADQVINGSIANAKKLDPDMTKIDTAFGKDVPNDVHWGKAMWIWEQMRAEKPDAIARYFRAKRRLAIPGTLKNYTADDCVAVMSVAMERDMFPWFRQHGIMVEKSRATIKIDAVPATGPPP